MLVVPDGADGGLEVLLAVLLLPPAIPDHLVARLSKSARWSFPESCQCVFLKCWHEHCAMQPHWSDRQTTFSPCATTQLLLLAFFRINVSSTSIIAGSSSAVFSRWRGSLLSFRVILFPPVVGSFFAGSIPHPDTGASGNTGH